MLLAGVERLLLLLTRSRLQHRQHERQRRCWGRGDHSGDALSTPAPSANTCPAQVYRNVPFPPLPTAPFHFPPSLPFTLRFPPPSLCFSPKRLSGGQGSKTVSLLWLFLEQNSCAFSTNRNATSEPFCSLESAVKGIVVAYF